MIKIRKNKKKSNKRYNKRLKTKRNQCCRSYLNYVQMIRVKKNFKNFKNRSKIDLKNNNKKLGTIYKNSVKYCHHFKN